jgi:hypothetical protein
MHKLADELQEHRMKLAEHELRLNAMSADIIDLRDTMATGEQLANAVITLTLKIDHLRDMITPIRRGVNAVVWLLVSSIIVALLGLLVMPRA